MQAGAGVVADSVPAREYEETMNKAKAMLKAVEAAEKGFLMWKGGFDVGTPNGAEWPLSSRYYLPR